MEAKNSWAHRKSVLGLSLSAAVLTSLLGVVVGVGGFTGHYAEGLSYFSKDPAACMNCHHFSEEETKQRVDGIQQRNFDLLQRSGAALMDQLDAIAAAKAAGASQEDLEKSLNLQRKAQWRLDFIAAENSMGFHAPQEAARIFAEAADYARQGQIAAMEWRTGQEVD
jgi:formate-dependent nitrite reductase cytochrome c552 subunit